MIVDLATGAEQVPLTQTLYCTVCSSLSDSSTSHFVVLLYLVCDMSLNYVETQVPHIQHCQEVKRKCLVLFRSDV